MKKLLTMKKRIFLLFLSAMMLCMANVPLYAVAIIPDGIIIEENLGGEEELMPMGSSDCPEEDDIDYDYYSQQYPISSSLQGCSGYSTDFIASGSAFFKPMTNFALELYFQSVSPGTWKKGYQNGYIDGSKCSIHFFKNMTTGDSYSGYKLKDGWVS